MLNGSPHLSLLVVLLSLGVAPLSLGTSPVVRHDQPEPRPAVQHRRGAPLVAQSGRRESLPPELLAPVVVTEVLAPDKLVVRTSQGPELVRLLGVDAIRAPGYHDAVLHQRGMALLAELTVGHQVNLRFDPRWQPYDADGDLCAWLVRTRDHLPVNLEMVRRGYLLPSLKHPTRWHPQLRQAAAAARIRLED